MVHDPLCPAASRCTTCGCKRCECPLIATVRADQAATSYREGYNAHASSAAHWETTHGAYRQHGAGENP